MTDIYDLIIIGAGPAGVSASIYATRKRLRTLIISKDFQSQVSLGISVENYLGFKNITGVELAKKFEEHLKSQEIEILTGEVVKIKKENQFFEIITNKGERYVSLVIIIASGADLRFVGVPGEKEFISRGVSYCTTCDAPFFKDKVVAVIGGGNSGVISAIELTSYARKVYLLEYQPNLVADELEQERARANEKITILTSSLLKEIKGNSFVEKIIYENLKNKEKKTLNIDGVFVSIGTQPATSFIKELVDLNEKGEIMIDIKNGQTKTPGLFAAGDVTNIEYNQIIIAAGEGAKTALSVYEYLRQIKK